MTRPFDKEKYDSLLSGLEISDINFSELDKVKNRIDSKFYEKRHLTLERKFSKIGTANLQQLGAKLDCSAFYPSITEFYNFSFEGTPFIRVDDLKNGLVRITDNTVFLPEKILDANNNTIAKAFSGDILIAKGGNTLAKIGFVSENYSQYSTSRDIITLRTQNLAINKFFLWAYLSSKFGQDFLWRIASQTGQPHLTLDSMYEIKVPLFEPRFQKAFQNLYEQSSLSNSQSKQIYQQAEEELLKEIGLFNFAYSEETFDEKNFSESFLLSGRLDAEYYQPKYSQLTEALMNKPHRRLSGLLGLASIIKSIETGSNAYAEIGLPYIRVADLTKFGISETKVYLSDDYYAENKKTLDELKVKRDTVLLTKDGTVGIAYKVETDIGAITSGAIIHLRIKNKDEILPDFLTLVLNSQITQLQAERDAGGSIIIHWRIAEIENVLIPLLPMSIQERIVERLQESFRLKSKSERLLDIAKRAVETAIEETEETALGYINSELTKS